MSLQLPSGMRNLLRHILHLPRNCILGLLWTYRHTLSPDHGPLRVLWPYGYCRHHPTCSSYAMAAVREHGAVMGMLRTTKRLLSCHPWAPVSDEKLRALASSQTE